MSKHTPGPWTVGDSGGYLNQRKIEPTIGVVYGAGEEIQANAHLIAAAPDLLESCRFAAMALAAAAERDPSFQQAYEKVSSAIAKAIGE